MEKCEVRPCKRIGFTHSKCVGYHGLCSRFEEEVVVCFIYFLVHSDVLLRRSTIAFQRMYTAIGFHIVKGAACLVCCRVEVLGNLLGEDDIGVIIKTLLRLIIRRAT